MIPEQALNVLQFMIDGIDPVTGEFLDDDHFCNSPEVLEALYAAMSALKQQTFSDEKWRTKKGTLHAERPWTSVDVKFLRSLYKKGTCIEDMCRILQRRPRSLEKKLISMGLKKDRRKYSGAPDRAGFPWEPAEEEALRTLYHRKVPLHKIAVCFQRTDGAIFSHMKKMSLFGSGEGEGYPTSED